MQLNQIREEEKSLQKGEKKQKQNENRNIIDGVTRREEC